jgi:hypothetical protein
MNRTYKMLRPRAGLKGTIIAEFVDGREEAAVLHLPDGTPPEALADVTTALQQALRTGREDRSGEILGDEGLARAGVAAGGHEFDPAIGESDWGTCSCGAFACGSVPLATWRAHLAYEILQAAARTT